MVQEYAEVLAVASDSPVVEETAADEGVSTATTDAEDTQETPKRGGPRYKDQIAKLEKELADARAEAARRDENTRKELSEATRALNAMLAREQQSRTETALAQTYREIDAEAQRRADRLGWDEYTLKEWADERKQLAQAQAQVVAEKKLADAQKEQAKLTEAQSNAIKARPREVSALITNMTKEFAEDNELDVSLLKLDPAQVIVALKKDPWENGAVDEAQRVIFRMLNKQSRELESKGRQETLAERAKNGTDVMPQGTSGARSARQVWQAWADGDPNTTRQDAEKARAVLKRQGALR